MTGASRVHAVTTFNSVSCGRCWQKLPAIVGFPPVGSGATVLPMTLTCTFDETRVVAAFPAEGAKVQARENHGVL